MSTVSDSTVLLTNVVERTAIPVPVIFATAPGRKFAPATETVLARPRVSHPGLIEVIAGCRTRRRSSHGKRRWIHQDWSLVCPTPGRLALEVIVPPREPANRRSQTEPSRSKSLARERAWRPWQSQSRKSRGETVQAAAAGGDADETAGPVTSKQRPHVTMLMSGLSTCRSTPQPRGRQGRRSLSILSRTRPHWTLARPAPHRCARAERGSMDESTSPNVERGRLSV